MSTLGRRYARALLELAVEGDQLGPIRDQMRDLLAVWHESAELREVFENPLFTQPMRRQVLESLAQRLHLSPSLRNTALLLSDRRRMRFLPEIAQAFEDMAGDREGRVRAEVVTATALPDDYYEQLQKTLERVIGCRVVLQRREDPSLIGGVVTRVGDKVFDGSVRTRLSELRDELLSN